MVFCDAYLPGERGGGGMWAVRNLAERFCDRYDLFIVTRDCDGRIDGTPYTRVPRNKWTTRPEAKVFYASPSHLKAKTFARLVAEIAPDAIYLNSVFSKPCVQFLLARGFYLRDPVPIVLATCGEFSTAAMKLTPFKKRAYLVAARAAGLFRNILWKAATEPERDDIRRIMGKRVPIKVAPELSPKDILPDFSADEKPQKRQGSVKLVFFSRVTPIKNLDFLLEILRNVDRGSIYLDVIGPTDDLEYLNKCRRMAAALPRNIKVTFLGSLERDAALDVIKTSHFMVLPSKSENFGYVIIESLAAGCPVLLSDKVSWNEVEDAGAGWLVPLTNKPEWRASVERCVWIDSNEYRTMSFSAREFAVRYLIAEEPTEVNRVMFDSVFATPYVNG